MSVIQVCIGSACHLKGSYQIIKKFQQEITKRGLEGKIELKGAFCLGHCTQGVSIKIDDQPIISVSEDSVEKIIEKISKE
ncbi:NAD(P)H-dependent oxidoreductase subunit E [Garciella nitratireducens]|uniref:Thioredoxin-like [2Fe-2S] ferredoxin n=1 Tax=Garciella nitratireducens DSM 15102 TaxID=1121911 RepID=A0A1T4KQA2_9FIRM|nr:NAD(P)H-dependent oxidoreductase subunit E [Garciella nitratireducens]SJZ44619.1 Thioredoxin-like [2Fe-2S] ferredoxin [Garciella nitratireducens DSM 15102]